MKTTTVPELVFHTFIDNDASLIENCNSCLMRKQHLIEVKQNIIKKKRAAARFVVNDYDFTSSVTEMLKTLHWHTVEQRRIQKSLVILYKINHYLVAVDHHHLIVSRNLNFQVPYSRTKYHINLFFPRTIRY